MSPGPASCAARAGVLLLLSLGCRKPGNEQRTLDKLQAEALRQSVPVVQDPNAELAAVVAQQDATPAVVKRPLPSTLKPALLGPLVATLTGAETTQTVSTGKLSLSTSDRFLKVELALYNGGTTPVPLELGRAKVLAGKVESGLAPDVQRAVGTQALHLQVEPGASKPVTLYFEVSASALTERLTLVLPTPDGSTAPLVF